MAPESLILFAKPPLAGRVKTRLAESLGREGAARLYACFLRDAAETARALCEARPGVSLVCEWALERGESLDDFPLTDWLPGAYLHRAQTGADLGARMAAALGRCLIFGRRAALIGTDFPDLRHEVLHDAFESLENTHEPKVTLGPAADGGYYLIGMNRFFPEIFTGIPWSTSEVLSRTVERADALGIGTSLLPGWRDVDEADDLEALKGRLSQNLARAPHTRNFLR
ncbi:MAG: TIGR04282 family arsenosugar biosynthesis glycosyltransferase [Nitrospinae bacterium]|nr:TIGR04282 family arsenosugar biosynthesis glycosyltransferase [Nitrospinota bacterium]